MKNGKRVKAARSTEAANLKSNPGVTSVKERESTHAVTIKVNEKQWLALRLCAMDDEGSVEEYVLAALVSYLETHIDSLTTKLKKLGGGL